MPRRKPDAELAATSAIPVAFYVRMSTDQQQYSIANQTAGLTAYAAAHGMAAVQVYTDGGRSGLTIEGRPAMRQLIEDVRQGRATYRAVLVYDISRWGRFADPDEAAHYEFLCRRAGIQVVYIAETFSNDMSMTSAAMKSLKRVMAHEYSRELSAKVTAGQRRLASLGFRQGAAPGYGLRRMLIDQAGNPRGVLEHGQHKATHTDRVILTPGPQAEVDVVRGIFSAYGDKGMSTREIAASLNVRRIATVRGCLWRPSGVRDLLSDQKYIGTYLYGRTTTRLNSPQRTLPRDSWLRVESAHPSVIDRRLFDRVQSRFRAERAPLGDQVLIEHLRSIATEQHGLSRAAIERSPGRPSPSTFARHFGSLREAFERADRSHLSSRKALNRRRSIHNMHATIERDFASAVAAVGCPCERPLRRGPFVLADGVTVQVVTMRCETEPGRPRWWRFQRRRAMRPDLLLLARLDPTNAGVMDYFLVPSSIVPEPPRIARIAEENGLWLDAFRHRSLGPVAENLRRGKLPDFG